ncbi:MAG: sugar phosphate isomerase/epimerase family protein [Candidatus Hinthialibacter sp.]
MSHSPILSRRGFLAAAAAGMALPAVASSSTKPSKPSLICFSKHLQFSRDYNELADLLADLGYDGADLTVRRGGHVLPENVERDLPQAVDAIRKAGLDVQMITSDISDPDHPQTERVLKTASALGIPYYRIGTWRYEKNRPIMEQLDEYKPRLKKLAAMNAEYKIRAGYHNHSGSNYIGGSMWDLYEIYREVDPRWVGYNYDGAHAVAEGSAGSWETTYQLIKDRIFGVAVKDCAWMHDPQNGWRRNYPPVGEGMVNWPYILQLLKKINFTGPFSMHFEYDIPGEGEEKRKNELQCIRRDFIRFQTWLREAGMR